MNESQRIQDLITRILSGPAWHGNSLFETLADVTATGAARKPAGAAHSIWELVLHVTTWAEVVRHRLSGPFEVKLNSEQDWPSVGDPSPDRWVAALDSLRRAHHSLAASVGKFEEQRLSAIVPGGDEHHEITYDVLLHGAIHHAVYHSAQMAMVKRMLRG